MNDPKRARKILIATGNPGKFREIVAVLSDVAAAPNAPVIQWTSLDSLPREIAEPVEDQDTFEGNAILKARYYSKQTGLWTLADDSGLEVDALGGEPGVHSARYAGSPPGTPREEVTAANNRKLVKALAEVEESWRSARFRCVMALADGDDVLAVASGAVEGQIIDEPRGGGGFGYDPHFFLPQLDKTMAELDPEHKNRISHRGRALRAMCERLRSIKV